MPARHYTDGSIDYAKRNAKILALRAAGVSYRDIAERFGLTKSSVAAVLNRLKREKERESV